MANTQKTGDDEVYKPISDWKEELENNILTVHLPDFTKEQIKITCIKSSRMVRVHGDRKVANNKWSRFNEAFPIPDNCKIDKIHAKWHNESLIVTMPKENITLIAPKENITPIAPKEELKTPKLKEPTNIAQQPLPSKQGDAATTGTSISAEQNENKSSAIVYPPKATPSIHGEKQTDGERVVGAHQKDEKDTKPQKGTEETSQKLSSISNTSTKQKTDDDKTVVPKPDKLAEHKEKSEDKIKETPPKLKKPENVVMDTKRITTEKKEEKKGKTEEKKSNMAADAWKALMEQPEERQLIINMGVAVLVIVALGAYISYSFATKSKTSKS